MATMTDESLETRSGVLNYRMYVDGDWIEGADGVTDHVLDPATEEVIATVPRGGRADAERAVLAARHAFDNGPWPRLTALERADVLRAIATGIRERADELARLEALQMGKLLADSLIDVNDAAHTFDYYAGLAVEQHGQTLEVPGDTMSMVVREPIGVTVGITPWNYPLLMAAWKLAPSLAAGNVMILKPAEPSRRSPRSSWPRICRGGRSARGRRQRHHRPRARRSATCSSRSPHVDMVAFTGSVEVGKHIMRKARRHREEGRPRAGRQEPQHRLRGRRLRGRHRRRPVRHLRRPGRGLLGRLAGCSCSAPSTTASSASSSSRALAIKVGPALDSASEMGPLVSADQLAQGRGVRAHRRRRGRDARHRRPSHRGSRASTSSRRSSSTSTTRCASPRRRSSGRCWS